MKAGALIPCRRGSKEIPNKNFRELCGNPLWQWTADAAVKSGIFEKIIMSSDGGFSLGAEAGKNSTLVLDNYRPTEYATDEARLDPLMVYYAEQYPEIELWCLLQPTSPLRTSKDIQKAYKKVCAKKWDSLVSVTKGTMMYWIEDATTRGHAATYHYASRPNRQDREGFYREVGAIYFVKTPVLLATKCRLGGDIALYKMPKERSFSINDEIDWKICEMLLGEKNG